MGAIYEGDFYTELLEELVDKSRNTYINSISTQDGNYIRTLSDDIRTRVVQHEHAFGNLYNSRLTGEDTPYTQELLEYFGAQLVVYKQLERYAQRYPGAADWIRLEQDLYTPLAHFGMLDKSLPESNAAQEMLAMVTNTNPHIKKQAGNRAITMIDNGLEAVYCLQKMERSQLLNLRAKAHKQKREADIYDELLAYYDKIFKLSQYNFQSVFENRVEEDSEIAHTVAQTFSNNHPLRKIQMIFGLGLINTTDNMKIGYRAARARAKDGFMMYEAIADYVVEFMSSYAPGDYITLVSHTQKLRDPLHIVDGELDESQAIERLNNQLRQLTKDTRAKLKNEITIDPSAISNWHGFVVPQSIHLYVPRGTYTVIMRLTYQNSNALSNFEFGVALNGTEDVTFDWSLLDDPHTEGSIDLRDSCVGLLNTALTALIEREKAPVAQSIPAKNRTSHSTEKSAPDGKAPGQRKQKPHINSAVSAQNENKGKSQERRYYKPIVLSDEDTMSHLPPNVQEEIRQAIGTYNMREEYFYKGFAKLSHFEDVFVLHVGVYRVVVVNTAEGYVVEKVMHRREVYKKKARL